MKNKLSFRSSEGLGEDFALLAKHPVWESCTVSTSVKNGTTAKPSNIFYREGIDTFRLLYGNTAFAREENIAMQVWEDDAQIFEGPMTVNMPWEIHV